MTEAFTATFFDGVTAARTAVIVRRDFQSVLISDRDTGRQLARWPVADVIEYREEESTELYVIGPRDGDARLHVTGGGIIRDAKEVLPGIRGAGVPWPMLRKVGILTVGALGSLALLIFVILPAMATQLAAMIPPEREVAFGKTVRAQIERVFGADETGALLCEAPEGKLALAAMTNRILGDAEVPYEVLSVEVFDHSLVNAFALPGGHVVLFRGLVEAAEHPDEVAAVLAHEIGHVVARDPTRIALQTAGSAGLLGLVLGDFAGGTIALALANQFLQASYSQEAEVNADIYAHERLEAAGLPPEALAVMFERLREEHGDTSGLMAHFSSHPQLVDRIEAARAAAHPHQDGPPSLAEAEWADLRSICDDDGVVEKDKSG